MQEECLALNALRPLFVSLKVSRSCVMPVIYSYILVELFCTTCEECVNRSMDVYEALDRNSIDKGGTDW